MGQKNKPLPVLDEHLGRGLQRVMARIRLKPEQREDAWQFLAYAMGRAREAHGQLFQDLWALWMSGEKRNGYFVEVGAADGVHLSNTYYLESRMGWTGILAEPNPRYAEALKRRRCIVSPLCVSSTTGERVGFLNVEEMGELSRMEAVAPGDANEPRRQATAQRLEVETIRLNDLLERHGAPSRIDYLSVDTEGAELEILRAFDFDRWDVAAITVEHNYTLAREALYALLKSKGYKRVFPELSMFDDWYVKVR
jgi:FkbM family methyltransferase